MISTFFGRKFRQKMSLQRSGKLFLNLFLHFCAPTHRHFINCHFLVYQNTSHVEFNHILHLSFCGNVCQFLDCFCVCFMSGFKLIDGFLHLSLSPQADRYGVCTIFFPVLSHVWHICKPIGFQIGILAGCFAIVCKCHFRKVVRRKCIRDGLDGFEILCLDLDVAKTCTIGNFKFCFVFKDNFVHDFYSFLCVNLWVTKLI
nr:MAG TPA_asm: hypothetical protein [Caudoviricetes sp.]